ncbi:MAG: YrdB family protein [Chloroflexota bacterium]
MALLQNTNLGVAFLLELVAFASFAYWGFNASDSTVLKLVLGLGTPILAIVLWGIFAAPQSERRLRGSTYLVFKVIFFALATLALFAAGSLTLGFVFALVFVINTVLIAVWHQDTGKAMP